VKTGAAVRQSQALEANDTGVASVADEIELKLALPKSAVKAVKTHPLLVAAGPPKRVRLRSIYFDTPEFALREHGASLRVRRVGRTWVQTFKQGGTADAGLHRRVEAECMVRGPAVDLAALQEVAGAGPLSRKRIASRLIQVFETVFARTTWELDTADGSRIEVALDQGEIWSAGRSAAICEVELELLAGDPAALYRAALALQEALPLCPENLSKAERGYRLFGNEEPAPERAAPIALLPQMSPAQALGVIASSCIAHLQANVAGAQGKLDPEYVHQMRVALRRLRAALGIFTKAVIPGVQAIEGDLVTQLRALAAELGAARDWDVFQEQTLQPLCMAFPEQPALKRLQQQAAQRADAAYRRLQQVLGAPSYARLLLRLSAALQSLQSGAAPIADAAQAGAGAGTDSAAESAVALRALARTALAKRHKRLARDAAMLVDADGGQRHGLRIDAKKLRYAAEFFSGLFDAKASARYARKLAELQELLGRLNDAATAHVLLDMLGPEPAARVPVEAWLAATQHEALRELPGAAKGLMMADRFWKH
jgi:inorganic triphosphatase YgiF